MTPTIGRIVHYKLSLEDAGKLNKRYDDGAGPRSAKNADSGAQVHVGNRVERSETVPMIITKVWTEESVNGQVILDGNDSLWVTSAVRGQNESQWDWPPRVD